MHMHLEELILDCLEKHPGANSNKITKFVNKEQNIINDSVKSTIYKKIRTLKRDRQILNKGNCWYLMKQRRK